MDTKNLILIENLCSNYNITFSFINSLHKQGLIEIVIIEEGQYLPDQQLNEVEKMIRLHQDLDINPEGIDVIFNLLEQIDQLQRDLNTTKNRLRFFE